MSNENELLPCPFCGGEADEYEGDYGNGIYCMMCGAMVGEPIHLGYMTTKRVSIDEAIAAWNARAERTCRNTHENRWFKCSACGYGFTDLYAEDESDINEQPRYCPNCGCKVVDA